MKEQILKKKKLPDTPGVYFFLGKKGSRGGMRGREILYIGKAGSLKNRVRSYFGKGLSESRSPGIVQMVEIAEDITYEKTDSVLEALILESALIKKHKPKYNVKEKDNKSFNYIVITKEDFPQIVIKRERDLLKGSTSLAIKTLVGPFPQGGVLKEALAIIRKIFPFRDNKCTPYDGEGKGKKVKPCFSYQIGLCPGVCVGEVSKKEYASTIKNIELFLTGKKKTLIKKLEKEMSSLAKKKEFEKAGKIKKTIFSLKHIHDIALLKSEGSSYEEESFRIEAYDVAHMSGENMVGVMVVLEDGEANKNEYRKFKIQSQKKSNDTGALSEMLERRFKHGEWADPQLIVVDGSTAQIRVAERIVKKAGKSIPVVSVVKDEHHRPREIKGPAIYRKKYEKDIVAINNEAHRFAIAYHKRVRGKKFIEK